MNYFPVAPSAENNFLSQHIDLIAKSFENLLGYPLLVATDARPLAEHLFYAPFVLLSHNTGAEPLFNYANLQGLQLFELNWQDCPAITRLSRSNESSRAGKTHDASD